MNAVLLEQAREERHRQLAEHTPLLSGLAEAVCGLMRLKPPPPSATKRRPSYRLVVKGDDGHDLVAVSSPSHDRLQVELFANYLPEGNPRGRPARCKLLDVRVVLPDSISLHRWYPRTYGEDLGRLVRLAGHWLRDPLQPIGGTATHCCICGRHLSDTVSKARGIGPECIQWAGPALIAGATDGEGRKWVPVGDGALFAEAQP